MEDEPILTADKVVDTVKACLFTEKEVNGRSKEQMTKDPNMVLVIGIHSMYGFHKDKLEEYKPAIIEMLGEVRPEFHHGFEGAGGGWEFSQMCMDKHGRQWADMHGTMEGLMALGIAINRVRELPAREGIEGTGYLPYYVIYQEDSDTPMNTYDTVFQEAA